jgi:hypothetical protein
VTISDEDFKRILIDHIIGVTTQRHEDIMAQASDTLAKITAAVTLLETMKTNLDKVLADYSATAPAGHAAVLDTFTAPLDDLATKISAFGTDMEAKIKALPVPGATPAA